MPDAPNSVLARTVSLEFLRPVIARSRLPVKPRNDLLLITEGVLPQGGRALISHRAQRLASPARRAYRQIVILTTLAAASLVVLLFPDLGSWRMVVPAALWGGVLIWLAVLPLAWLGAVRTRRHALLAFDDGDVLTLLSPDGSGYRAFERARMGAVAVEVSTGERLTVRLRFSYHAADGRTASIDLAYRLGTLFRANAVREFFRRMTPER